MKVIFETDGTPEDLALLHKVISRLNAGIPMSLSPTAQGPGLDHPFVEPPREKPAEPRPNDPYQLKRLGWKASGPFNYGPQTRVQRQGVRLSGPQHKARIFIIGRDISPTDADNLLNNQHYVSPPAEDAPARRQVLCQVCDQMVGTYPVNRHEKAVKREVMRQHENQTGHSTFTTTA